MAEEDGLKIGSMALSQEYLKYINSQTWARKRARALERAGYKCQVCNDDRHLEVHHRTYERLGKERVMDLTVLCRECHHYFHELKKGRKVGPQKNRLRRRGGKGPAARRRKAKLITADSGN